MLANLCCGLKADEISDLEERFKDKDLQKIIDNINQRLLFEEYENNKNNLKQEDKINIEEYIKTHFLSENCKFCVYRITDRLTGFEYIGKANNAYKRWFQHLKTKGCRGNDWHFELYTRPEDFYFEVIEECDNESMTYDKEAKHIAKAHYIDGKKLYNAQIPYKVYYSPVKNI